MRRKTTTALAILAVIGSMALAGCGQAKAYASQCVYLIASGYLDAHHLHRILHPGQKANSTGDTKRYIYCNARNYLVRPGGDREAPLTGRTEPNSDGTPGNPVNVQLSMYWQLNQNDSVLQAFLPYCEKFNCWNNTGDTSGSDRFSSEGWNGMLHETFDPALERATVQALQQFHGNLPTDQASWPKLGDAIANNFMAQVKVADGSGTNNFFCSSGSPQTGSTPGTGYECQPPRIAIDHVEYANAQAQDLFNQSTTLDAQRQLADKTRQVNAAQMRAARAKYGSYAPYFLGLLDAIAACNKSGSSCVFNVGGGSVAVPRP